VSKAMSVAQKPLIWSVASDGFRAYRTWQDGDLDWYRLMRTLSVRTWHLTTVAQMVPGYAPTRAGNDSRATGRGAAVAKSAATQRRIEAELKRLPMRRPGRPLKV